ncbi:unnamed protein product, partial [Scytosiphon promiscuus]
QRQHDTPVLQGVRLQERAGPGLYDIHSPVVPPVATLQEKLEGFLNVLPKEQLVCNPDCGLKTRTWPQVLGALRNLVEATHNVR